MATEPDRATTVPRGGDLAQGSANSHFTFD